MAKNLERIGDHATNIAETVYFLVKGTSLNQDRPKQDATASILAPTPRREDSGGRREAEDKEESKHREADGDSSSRDAT